MNIKITRNRRSIALAVVALSAAAVLWGAGWLQPAAAQSGDGSVKWVSRGITGFVPGQKLRISVGYAGERSGTPLVWTYRVTNLGSDPLYESDRIPVPSGEFRSRDLFYTGLEEAGEPGTGRVQVMVKIVIELPSGVDPSFAIRSLEIIDNGTGKTLAAEVLASPLEP